MSNLSCEIAYYPLNFAFKAKTSRGELISKPSWFLRINDKKSGKSGWGECSVIPDLCVDGKVDYLNVLPDLFDSMNGLHFDSMSELEILRYITKAIPPQFPAARMAFEMAFLDLKEGSKRIYFQNDFSRGNRSVSINGLIWMGDFEFMMSQVHKKVKEGFKCIKLKVGGIDFQRECEILGYIRAHPWL